MDPLLFLRALHALFLLHALELFYHLLDCQEITAVSWGEVYSGRSRSSNGGGHLTLGRRRPAEVPASCCGNIFPLCLSLVARYKWPIPGRGSASRS